MTLDPSLFSFTDAVERNYPVFRRELEELSREEFTTWPVEGVYTGSWLVFPLILHCEPPGLAADIERNRRRCPGSFRVVSALPRVCGAAFSRLEPGTCVGRHRDLETAGVIRCHLGLRIPPLSRLWVGDGAMQWEEGRVLLFDGQIEHEAENSDASPRDVLIIDFGLTPEERDYVDRARQVWCRDPDADIGTSTRDAAGSPRRSSISRNSSSAS